MKNKYIIILFSILLFPSINSAGINLIPHYTTSTNNPVLSLPNAGVSNYNITQSVTYQVELTFNLTHRSSSGNYYFKFARLNNRVPSSAITKYTPPYQESTLLSTSISGNIPGETRLDYNDKFNNTYDSFNSSLLPDDSITFFQNYTVKLNAITFQEIDDADIGTYDLSDDMFSLYCNKSEQYYERNETSLINLSNSIVDPGDNLVEKAKKICDWVANNIAYNGLLPPQEKGALWAYNNLQGDCSEYSSLMITLLRIQGIPARKVTGFLISNNPGTRPAIGNIWTFNSNEVSSDILGHAWVEYYIPDIGWIACDPTWHRTVNYFNRIDFLRFNLNIGAHFFFPPSFTVSEFSNPIIGFGPGADYDYDYEIKITVLETDLIPLSEFPIYITIFIVVGFLAVIGLAFLLFTRGRKKVIESYD
ncbi:MAG: transglutaminase family protein [Candidatus Thorarchaeota archaeon]